MFYARAIVKNVSECYPIVMFRIIDFKNIYLL